MGDCGSVRRESEARQVWGEIGLVIDGMSLRFQWALEVEMVGTSFVMWSQTYSYGTRSIKGDE